MAPLPGQVTIGNGMINAAGALEAGGPIRLKSNNAVVGAFNVPESVILRNASETNGNSTAISNRDSRDIPNVIVGFNNIDHIGTGTFAVGTRVAGGFSNRLSIEKDGAVVVANDPRPGVSERLRVGGGALVNGQITSLLYSPASDANSLACFQGIADYAVGARSRILKVGERAFMDFETAVGGRGILRFGSDFGGRADVMSLNASTQKVFVHGGLGIGSTAVDPKAQLQIDSGGYASVGLGSDGPNVWYLTKEIGGSFNIWQGPFGSSSNRLCISPTGNVGIGSEDPKAKLAVNGTIRAKEVRVEASPWPDSVFEKGYVLPSLKEVRDFIAQHGHLSGIPSAQEVAREGVSVGDMHIRQMKKIEELTLYALQADKEMTDTKARLLTSETEIARLQTERDHMRQLMEKMMTRIERLESVSLDGKRKP